MAHTYIPLDTYRRKWIFNHKDLPVSDDDKTVILPLTDKSAMLVWNPETLFRLRAAVGPMVGLNLDPSHLIWMGADPIAVARALGPAIHHVHGKDVRLERGVVEVNGLLETKPIDDVAGRAWNYVAVGAGRDLRHHPAEPGVLVDAAGDGVDEEGLSVDDADAGLVAGGLDAQDEGVLAHAAPACCVLARRTSASTGSDPGLR